jgi:predicted ester cyclase
MTYSPTLRNIRVIIIVLFCFIDLETFGQGVSLSEKNKNIIRRYIEVVINGHNLERKPDFFREDYTWHTLEGTGVKNNTDSSHSSTLRWLFNAIPDVKYTIDFIEAGGDMVGISTTATGTARGEMFGLPVSQKRVVYRQMFFYLLKEGKVTDQWEVVDVDGIKSQLAQK